MQNMQMFELPSAKRVRREDLYSPQSSPEPSEPDAELSSILQSRLASIYGFADDNVIFETPADTSQRGDLELKRQAPEEDEDEGFEFRLFAPTKSASNAATGASSDTIERAKAPRIILGGDEEDELNGEGAFVKPQRDPEYYFAAAAEGVKKWQFENVAVSGDDVRRWLGVRCPALEVPWRVQVLKVQGKRQTRVESFEDTDVNAPVVGQSGADIQRKKKPGKKMRIILRKKNKMDREAQEKERSERMSKEEAEKQKEATEREKKTRKNREKQAKKRAREKAKAAEVQAVETGDHGPKSDDGS